MIVIFQLVCDAGDDSFVLNTDEIAKLFGTNGKAININWVRIIPGVPGSAVDYTILADGEQDPDADAPSQGLLINEMVSVLKGGTGQIRSTGRPAFQDVFRFTTSEITGQMASYSLFPVFNQLAFGWSADVDCNLVIDFTVLNLPLDYQEEIMDLLGNKTQVEDPSGSNVDGKRVLTRVLLRTTGN